MSNPAFIVDGFTEKLILNRICPGKPVRRTDLNGKTVTVDAIANKVYSLIRLLNNRYYPIIVVIDREERTASSDEIATLLKSKLDEKGLNNQDIRVSVADKMIENWIIADWDKISPNNPKPPVTDGLGGAAVIKRELGSYSKTSDGVDLFIKMQPSIAYENSPSFKSFIDSINNIDCHYTIFEE
jgi:hypothetical protein